MKIRENITREEAACPLTGELPSADYLDWFQDLRERCGFALPFTSMNRSLKYNQNIGGSEDSAHLLCAQPDPWGAADIGINNPYKRWVIVGHAQDKGANNIEICDQHIHIGIAPHGHPMFQTLWWGRSK